ncbi:hypothetical protein BAUCODRAFT_119879 [Baudoinia panamericana UAMH 10762]|uniref:Amino acid permease/ SLC12A domain-containing protein n=1 Tax=Baudoinia panamericana (strain UAMH 10762) TaxID=717646 RepID=M2M030_BAUPA|nr:uncharacterized protein BAUCODRAFT_119879 [Baudoinia panamericana UAMH 10762]EMD00338.1 hypothetical protein BAUCODRAFT_119879 [Baudoinia panamericana UAMH 10762]
MAAQYDTVVKALQTHVAQDVELQTAKVLLGSLLLVIIDGGTAGFFWGYILVVIGYTLVYASLAEMASMAPTSGGQYSWVSDFAPDGAQRYLSYITRWRASQDVPMMRMLTWLCVSSRQSAITGIAFLVATIIQGLMVLGNANYVFERWHGTLLVIAVVSLAIFLNTFVARKLPLVEGGLAVLQFAGLFVVIINNAHDAFLQLANGGGWPSNGLAFFVGLLPMTLSLLGFDSAVHLSEEISGASLALPRAIMWPQYLNSFLRFVVVVTLIFTMGDLDEISASATGYPFIQVFYNTTNSLAGTDTMSLLLILSLFGSIWAFARDNGVPFSATIQHVHPKWSIPLNAILISLLVCILLSLINIGSSAALNAILALDLTALLASYTICRSCLVLKRLRGEPLPPRAWSLGRWGLAINIAAVCWLLPLFVFTLFPVAIPVAASSMNWACLLLGAVVLFANAYYFAHGRRLYISPEERLRRDLQGEVHARGK